MRRSGNKFKSNQNEAGWISTADVFIFGTCFLLLLLIVQERSTADIEDKLVASKQKELDIQKELDDAVRLVGGAEKKLTQVHSDLALEQKKTTSLGGKLDESEHARRRLNNKLVGLGGDLENVVLLVDISDSMRGTKQDNWGPTLEIIELWINNLEVSSAALILFGEDARLEFPMQQLNQTSRQKIVEILQQVNPTDNATNFLTAFEQAYQIPNIDTIIVFSDGMPSVDVEGEKIDRDIQKGETQEEAVSRKVSKVLAVHRNILAKAKNNPGVAINAIGLGEKVYTERTGNLLNDLALKNGGIFLAVPSKTTVRE